MGGLLARYDIRLTTDGELESARRLDDGEEAAGDANIYYVYMEPNAPSPRLTERLILRR